MIVTKENERLKKDVIDFTSIDAAKLKEIVAKLAEPLKKLGFTLSLVKDEPAQ